MFSMLYSLILINMTITALLAVIFYWKHPRKYDSILIFFVGNLISLIVTYFVNLEIGVGTGFGLFAIFSLMHFRENYNTYTMIYLFLSISMGLFSSLIPLSGVTEMEAATVLAIIGMIILMILLLLEVVLVSMKKCKYTIPVAEIKNIEARAKSDLGNIKVKDVNIPSIEGEMATVVVSYIRGKN
jgi:MFS family permease